MIILDMPQGSIDWIIARLWRLTASKLDPVITSTGKLSNSIAATKAIDKLIAGLEAANVFQANPGIADNMNDRELQLFLANYTGEKFSGNAHTERGHDCEPDAIAALSQILGTQIESVGMCVIGDDMSGVVSCSPDGLIYDGGKIIAGAEIKSPALCNFYRHAIDSNLPEDYTLQVHGSMAICEVDTWHFGSYFKGKPLVHVEVKRSKLTDALRESFEEFRERYQERYLQVIESTERKEPA